MVDSKKQETDIIKYADELSSKIIAYKKTKKHHFVFLKEINDLIASTLDIKDITALEKELSNMYNNRLKVNHKKKKDNPVKINMKDDYNEDDLDYEDEDEDY